MVDGCFGLGHSGLGCFGQALFQGWMFRTEFFYKNIFLYCGFYFHKRMNGKNIYCTSFLSKFITTVKTFIVYNFLLTFIKLWFTLRRKSAMDLQPEDLS